MKKIWKKRIVKVTNVKSEEVQFNEDLNRYYFVAVSPQRFDVETGTMYAPETVVIGSDNKQEVENLFTGFNNFFEINPEGFISVEKNEEVFIEDNDDIAE